MSTLQATHKAMLLKTFLVKLDFKDEETIIIFIHNQENISLIKNPILHN
jgi:hypothetical protein